jgi:hypothetical protein
MICCSMMNFVTINCLQRQIFIPKSQQHILGFVTSLKDDYYFKFNSVHKYLVKKITM